MTAGSPEAPSLAGRAPLALDPLPARRSAVDACAERLRAAIISGRLATGARLPPERALAGQLGVARVTLRSALSRLAEQRLLTVRQGSGYVVRDYHRDGGPDLLGDVGRLAQTPRELAAVARDLLLVRRKLAEAVLLTLAGLDRVSGAAAVDARIDELEELAREGASAGDVAAADAAIVAALLDATRSPVLQLCLNPIVHVLAELPELARAMYREPHDNVRGWRLLAAWLRAPETALIPSVVAELERRDRRTLEALAPPRRGPSRPKGKVPR
jgi:DNA-binding FadR family transcriptional regulator